MRRLIVLFLVFLLATPLFSQTVKLSTEQQQVWSMEEKYWQSVRAQDRQGYISLWDDDFVGWPYRFSEPIRKDVIRSDPFGMLQGRELKNVELAPKAVQMFKDVAVVHYLVTITYAKKDGGSEVQAARITHTWRKTDGAWLIIGGMSALVPASK